MVNPIKGPAARASQASPKKKAEKSIDARVKKAAKIPKPLTSGKTGGRVKSSQLTPAKLAIEAAEKASSLAKQRAIVTSRAAVEAQKKAFLSQRAHMAQQAAAARRARTAEKARKEAQKAAKKAATLRRVVKIKGYLAKEKDKRQGALLKKYLPLPKKKKKGP